MIRGHPYMQLCKLQTLEKLIGCGADTALMNGKGETPHRIALKHGCPLTLMILDKLDVSTMPTDQKERLLQPVPHYAIKTCNYYLLDHYLEVGGDVAVTDQENNTALHIAAGTGDVRGLRSILRKCETFEDIVNKKNTDGFTSLHLAARNGFKDIVHMLLNCRGIQIDIQTQDLQTALHLAVIKGHIEVVNLLVVFGVALDVSDTNGDTALHSVLRAIETGVAVEEDDDAETRLKNTAKFLVCRGANLTVQNNQGETPLNLLVDSLLIGELERIADERVSNSSNKMRHSSDDSPAKHRRHDTSTENESD